MVFLVVLWEGMDVLGIGEWDVLGIIPTVLDTVRDGIIVEHTKLLVAALFWFTECCWFIDGSFELSEMERSSGGRWSKTLGFNIGWDVLLLVGVGVQLV